MNLFGLDETRCRVLDFEVVFARFHMDWLIEAYRNLIDREPFNFKWRRFRIYDSHVRIHHGYAVLRGKPEFSVCSADTGRGKTAIAFDVEHSVRFPVGHGVT